MTSGHPGTSGNQVDVDRLAENVIAMTAEARMLRHEVAKEKRARVATLTVTGVVFLILLVFGGMLVWIGLSNRETVTQVGLTQDYIIECTTPGTRVPTKADPTTGHPCWDAGQQRQGQAIQQIIDGIVAQLREQIQGL